MFPGDETRRRRGCHVDSPWREVAAAPGLRDSLVETVARRLRYSRAPAPARARVSNAFCEPAWRAYKAAARYHGAAADCLAAGGAHTLVARDGAVHACGRDSCGQLGLAAGAYDVCTPAPLPPTSFGGVAVRRVAARAVAKLHGAFEMHV